MKMIVPTMIIVMKIIVRLHYATAVYMPPPSISIIQCLGTQVSSFDVGVSQVSQVHKPSGKRLFLCLNTLVISQSVNICLLGVISPSYVPYPSPF